jgi:hypothetical protein
MSKPTEGKQDDWSYVSDENPRILEYRPYVKGLSKVYKVLSFAFIVAILASGIGVFFFNKSGFLIPLFSLVVVMALIFYLEYVLILKPKATSKIQVFKNRILVQRVSKEFEILFQDIVALRPYKALFGFKLMTKDGKKYHFTPALERLDYVLESVYNFNPKLLNERDYKTLREKIILSDHSVARHISFFNPFYTWTGFFHLFLLPLSFFVFLISSQTQYVMIPNLIFYFFKTLLFIYLPVTVCSTLTFIYFDWYFRKQTADLLQQNPSHKRRDMNEEMSYYKRLFPVHLLMMCAFFSFSFKYDLNLLGFEKLSDGSYRWISQKVSDKKDTRYSLKNGDRILIQERDRVVEGRVVAISYKDSLGMQRTIASLGQKISVISEREEVVVEIESGGVQRIPLSEFSVVKGKVVSKLSTLFE